MEHHFDIEVAKEVGMSAAVIYYNIKYWCEKNRANGVNYHDGYYWTFNSVKAFQKLFPYLSDKKISSSLKLLEERGYIKSGNYNDTTYDRTKWYADIKTNMEISNLPNGDNHLPKKENGNTQNGEPIPYINHIENNHIKNTNVEEKEIYKEREAVKSKSKERFIPPNVEEVREYCFENGYDIDPQYFIDFYESKGWMVGKNKMVNWKAAVRTWVKNNKQKPTVSSKSNEQPRSYNPFTELKKEEGMI